MRVIQSRSINPVNIQITQITQINRDMIFPMNDRFRYLLSLQKHRYLGYRPVDSGKLILLSHCLHERLRSNSSAMFSKGTHVRFFLKKRVPTVAARKTKLITNAGALLLLRWLVLSLSSSDNVWYELRRAVPAERNEKKRNEKHPQKEKKRKTKQIPKKEKENLLLCMHMGYLHYMPTFLP